MLLKVWIVLRFARLFLIRDFLSKMTIALFLCIFEAL